MSDVIIHQLPEFEDLGYPPSVEYPLPANQLTAEHLGALTPWLRNFVGLTQEEGHALLEARWTAELDGPLASAVEWFLRYVTTSLVVQGNRSWLLGVLPETDVTDATFYLLPDPPDATRVRGLLHQVGFDQELLSRILVTFWGMREDFAPSGGIFLNDTEPDERFLDKRGRILLLNKSWMASIDGYDEWKGSLSLLTGSNGDILLCHPTGKVGWLAASENRIKPFASDLAGFLEEFARYQRESWVRRGDRLIHWPFDSYGPRR